MTGLFVLAALLAVQGTQFDTDTTFAVNRGSRLKVQTQGGEIAVTAWDRDQIRIQAEHSSRSYVDVESRGQTIELSAKSRRGMPGLVDYRLTVPTWMALDLGGLYAEISVSGTKAGIKAETLEGDIVVHGGADVVTLSTVNGTVELTGAAGRISVNAISDDIQLTDVEGDIILESVSGDIDVRQTNARSLDVQTVSGDIVFDGRVASSGTYSLSTHSGDVTVAMPEGSNATISVASAGGEVSSSFTARAERVSRRRQTFRLGNGGANVDIETFNGDIDLLRPDELSARSSRDGRDHGNKRPNKPRPRPEREHDEDDDHDRAEPQGELSR